jgi:hypothetical protein
MEKLSGTFYPFLTRDQIGAIKVASIYFDDVYLLTPISVVKEKEFKEHYQQLSDRISTKYPKLIVGPATDLALQDESVRATVDFQKQAKPLIDAGVIKIVNPFDEMKNVGLEREFQRIIEYRANQSKEADHNQHRVYIIQSLDDSDLSASELLMARDKALKNIMYDSAILVSKKLNAIPLTGNDTFDREFQRQIVKKEEHATWLSRYETEREQISYDIMAHSIFDNVPAFEHISFKDILNLRRHCENELLAFRKETRKLATFVSDGANDKTRTKKILDIVAKDVSPIVIEIERKVQLSRARWAKNLIEKSASIPTLASLTTTLLFGLPLQYGLLFAAGFAGVQASFETYFEVKDIQTSSGLAFIIRLRKKQ